MSTPVHSQATEGYGVGKGELYDKARPTYPFDAFSIIRKAVDKKDNLNIVEIGCGSGLFTRGLLAHPEWSSSVAALKAFEPSEEMRKVFAEATPDPRVTVADGTFTSVGVEDGWADLIVMATAFHWCQDLEAAMREFVRILKPGGTLTMIWNIEDRDKAAWLHECWNLLASHQKFASVFDVEHRWRAVLDMPVYQKNFLAPEEAIVHFHLPGTLEIVTERCLTWSAIAALPDGEKQKAKETFQEIINRGNGKVWINEQEGIFEVPYRDAIVNIKRRTGQ